MSGLSELYRPNLEALAAHVERALDDRDFGLGVEHHETEALARAMAMSAPALLEVIRRSRREGSFG